MDTYNGTFEALLTFHKDGDASPDALPLKDNGVKETIVRDIAHYCAR